MTARTMSVDALRDRLERGDRITVLDIRDEEARSEWAIPGSLHHDASEDVQTLENVELPGGAPIVAVCYAGNTSKHAAELLESRGFEAYSLAGGMRAWSLAWNLAEVTAPGLTATVLQIRRTGKGCLSYMVGSRSQAIVIDPSLAPEIYLDIAKTRGWSITHVLETHVHADHLSRARSVASRAWAKLVMPETRRVSFPRESVKDGDEIQVGDAKIKVLATPGHTAESVCYQLDGVALFTGDTLFLDTVGRPDLEATPEETRMRAASLHGSLTRLLALPDEVQVLPCHTSEPIPFDGRPVVAPMVDVRASVGPRLATREGFVENILARIPATPPNHRRIVAFNESGVFPDGDVTQWEAGANRCAVR